MTKIRRSKKITASLLAGVLLCQVSVFGVPQTSENTEKTVKGIGVDVVGEGSVTVTDVEDKVRNITSGSVVEVPDGMCIRVQAEAPAETTIEMRILDKEGKYELEDTSTIQANNFWRDVTSMGMEKKVEIIFGENAGKKNVRKKTRMQTRGSQEKPEVGDVFTGECVIEAVDGGNGHTVHGVTIGGFTGILAGTTAAGGCADHTAAAPYAGQQFTYKYTVTGVNKVTGEVTGNLYCTSVAGATDGVTKDSSGRLIGYQRISGTIVIHKSYSGYAKLIKGKTQESLTSGNIIYSLEGACYGVYRDQAAANEIAAFITDKDGNSDIVELEEGTYYVKEKSAPRGYKLDERIYPVTVTSGETAVVNVKDEPVYGNMDLILEKIDQETEGSSMQGAGSLEGAEFTIRYYAGEYTQDTLPQEPERTWVLKTKKEEGYTCKLSDAYKVSGEDFYYAEGVEKPILPLGTISIEETKAPKGYLMENAYIQGEEKISDNYYLTQIVQDNNEATIKGGNRYQFADRIARGDIEFRKKDEETQKSMARIPFQITSLTTGECHRIMTDENGYFSSASSYIKHSENTNTGQAESGVWFGINAAGENVKVNDTYGAFPYDTYELKELRCEENVGKALYKGNFKVTRDQYTVDLGTIMNPDLTIATSAKDEETGTHYAVGDDSVTIIDTVAYTGLKKGKEYIMKGILMDRETGEAVVDPEGNKITALQKFRPKTAEGSVEVEFQFDGRFLAGKSITVFEECYQEKELIAVHKDLEDSKQMIHFPGLKTSVRDDRTGICIAKAEKNMQITDVVEYHNLKKGNKYKITGTLMDKENQKVVKDAAGETVTSSVEFVAEDGNGTVEVRFEFDGRDAAGKTFVAFEKLYYGEKLYAVHADLEDEEQTIYVPSLETRALNKETQTQHALAGDRIELTDTVEYRNLLPGRSYTLQGIVIEKETKEPLCAEKQITFIPEKTDGIVELAFEINGKNLSGRTAVVYEEVKMDDKSVAEHKDPKAKKQSIYFPKIGTKAMDENSKTQEGVAKEKQKIIDRISYENLLPGETYVLSGVLMNKEDGKELMDKNGKKITAQTTFTPEKSTGNIEMTFELDAQELDGKAVVVFEKLFDEKEHLIAEEENIDNKDQTVTYKKTDVPAKTTSSKNTPDSSVIRKAPKTGVANHTFLWILTLGSLGTALAAGVVIYKRKKRMRKEI